MSQSTAGRSSALRRLGIPGATHLPSVEMGSVSAVYLLGALGSLFSEPFEARGIAGSSMVSVGSPAFQIRAVAGGGLVVERLLLTIPTAAGGGSWTLTRDVRPVLATPVVSVPVGGVPDLRAMVTQDSNAGGLGAGATEIATQQAGVLERLVVPAGESLTLRSNNPGLLVHWSLLWRELEDPVGG